MPDVVRTVFHKERDAPRESNSGANGAKVADGGRIKWATDLMAKQFAPVRYVVKGVLPEGLTLLAGKPKSGKSYLGLGAGIAIAMGGTALGSVSVEQGDVLYLALEDNERRLKARLEQMLGFMPVPARLAYATEWPRLDQGGIDEMEKWIKRVERPRLIVLDVFVKVRPPKLKDEQLYDADYRAAVPLKQLADAYQLGLLTVHHVSKRERLEGGDPFDEVSGTTGLMGAADTGLIMKRMTAGTQLYGRGRDMPEIDKLMSFDESVGSWTILGDTDTVAVSDGRRKVLDVIEHALQPPTPQEIARMTGMKVNAVYQMLHRMMRDGEVQRSEQRGRYEVVKRTSWSDEPA